MKRILPPVTCYPGHRVGGATGTGLRALSIGVMLLSSVLWLPAQVAVKYNGANSRRTEPTDLKTPTGMAETFEAGSTLTVNGTLSGTPTGGTLDLSLLTLTLPAGLGTGTVTSFSAGDLAPLFTTSEATATTTPALTFTLTNAAQNAFLAGPATGGAGAPVYRAIVAGDVPTLNQSTTGSAATLTTGRTIGMTGDVVWTSPAFDGSGNVTAAGTIQADSVALTTDTTGDYVATITGDSEITVSGAGTEGRAVTLAIAATIARDSEVSDAVSAHTGDATDAHAASAITNTPAGGIAATTVQAALNELDTEKANVPTGTPDGTKYLRDDNTWQPVSAGGSVATDAIFDAKGDLAVGTGANTAAKLSAGTNGHVLTLDSAESTGMKWAAPGAGSSQRTYAVVIAASDSVSTTGADYVCDGTDDQVQIQAAIDAVSTAGGGTVFLREGHYYYDDAAILPKNNVEVLGETMDGTVLVPSWTATRSAIGNGTNGGAFTASTPLTNFHLRNLTIDCTNANDSSYTSAVKGVFIQYMRGCSFERLRILEPFATALGIDFLVETQIRDIWIKNHGRGMNPAGSGVGGNGVGIGTGGFAVESFIVDGVNVYCDNGLGNNGVMVESQNAGALESKHMVISNCIIQGSYVGIRNSGVEHVTWSNIRTTGTTGPGAIISEGLQNTKPSRHVTIADSYFTDSAGYGILVDEPSEDITFDNVHVVSGDTHGIVFLATGTRFKFIGGSSQSNAGHGFYIQGSNTVNALEIVGFDASYNTTDGYNFANVNNLQIIGGFARNNGANGINLDGITGPAQLIGVNVRENVNHGILATNINMTTISGCSVILNADSGIYVNNTSASGRNNLVNNIIMNNGSTGAASGDSGIVLTGSSANTATLIRGNLCTDNQGTKTQRYGLILGSTNRANCIVEGNDFRDNLTGTLTVSGSSSTDVIRNNAGYNPQGPASITVTASPFTYTAGATPETVYIYGGTVSDVSKSSNTVATATGISVQLEPNEAVVVTYSVAPTMRKDRH